MLIRAKKDLSFVTREPVGLPVPRTQATTAQFDGIFMRPNLGNDGSMPAQGPYCDSPDIWLAGTDAIANYQAALATSQSYGSQSSNNIYIGQTNIIYVRGRNGAAANKDVNVTLYYAPSGVIQSPCQWKNNIIQTDGGLNSGQLKNLTPGAVGVCAATFAWPSTPPPPDGSDHYCLFAQFNDASNSNPFPLVETALDMGALITTNLGWGWRNTTLLNATTSWQSTQPLNIPADYPNENVYTIYVTPTGYVGWDVEFSCTETDANGNPIQLARTTITQDGLLLGVDNVVLEPGFTSLITVSLYSPNGQPAPVGATIPLSCNFMAQEDDLREAVARNIVDWEFMRRLKNAHPRAAITPTAWIAQGSYTWKTGNTTTNK